MGWIASKRIRLWPCLALLVHAQAFAFNIDDLRTLIRDNNLTSVEQVIARLPEEYKENYTLAYHSQSLQGSSHDNPRAILFGRTAQFILTFNGDPSQQYYNAIETLQFQEQSESFELYSIDFSGAAAEVSGPNPQVCMSCHGSPPHVIWSSYEYGERKTGHWPGFYGSSHDAPVLNPDELAAYERFRKLAASHPRYRHLVMSKPGAPWFPYGMGPNQHRLRPNDRLGNLLARWQARQIAALIDRGGFIEHHPRTAQAFLLQCPGIEHGPYRRQVHALFDARFPQQSHPLAHALLEKLPPAQRTAFMMQKLLVGSDTFGWDMNIAESESNGQFSTGIVNIDQLVGARWLAALDDGHWLKAYYRPWESRELYNTFAPEYYEHNVAPGGVGEEYDRVMSYYDEDYAHLACPGLMRQALAAAGQ
jgi:hypothetical protein